MTLTCFPTLAHLRASGSREVPNQHTFASPLHAHQPLRHTANDSGTSGSLSLDTGPAFIQCMCHQAGGQSLSSLERACLEADPQLSHLLLKLHCKGWGAGSEAGPGQGTGNSHTHTTLTVTPVITRIFTHSTHHSHTHAHGNSHSCTHHIHSHAFPHIFTFMHIPLRHTHAFTSIITFTHTTHSCIHICTHIHTQTHTPHSCTCICTRSHTLIVGHPELILSKISSILRCQSFYTTV